MSDVGDLEKVCEFLLKEIITLKSQQNALLDVLEAFQVVDRETVEELAVQIKEQIEAEILLGEEEEEDENIIGGDPYNRTAPNSCDGS